MDMKDIVCGEAFLDLLEYSLMYLTGQFAIATHDKNNNSSINVHSFVVQSMSRIPRINFWMEMLLELNQWIIWCVTPHTKDQVNYYIQYS